VSQGWTVNPTTDQITFLEAPANAAAIVVKEYATADLNVTDVWALGAWSQSYGYPGEVEFFADRLTFAASSAQPQTLWLSRTGDYTFFGKSTPIVDDDSISATLNARGLNRIQDIIPLQSLVVLTSGSEWRATGGDGDAITPSTLAFRPQTHIGVASLQSLVVGATAIFAQNKGNTVFEMAYDFGSDGYTDGDLLTFSSHLMENHTIRDWTWQQVPYTAAWVARDDGVLLSMTYKREQQVVGWMRHVTGAPRTFVRGHCNDDLAPYDEIEQVVTVPEANINAVYWVVKRRLGNGTFVRYVERMAEPKRDLVDYIGLDCTLSTDNRVCGGITLVNEFNPGVLHVSSEVGGGTYWDYTCTQYPLALSGHSTLTGISCFSPSNAVDAAEANIYGQEGVGDGFGSSGVFNIALDTYTAFTNSVDFGGVVLCPGTDFGFGCGGTQSNIYKYRISTKARIALIDATTELNGGPVINAAGTYMYAACHTASGGPKYVKLNTTSNSFVIHTGSGATVSGASSQRGCLLNAAETILYMSGSATRAITLGTDVQLWEHLGAPATSGLTLSKDGTILFAFPFDGAETGVQVLNAATGALITTITVSTGPKSGVLSVIGDKLYVSCTASNRVYCIDVASLTVENYVEVPGAAVAVIIGANFQ
jgi:hypothetical protein